MFEVLGWFLMIQMWAREGIHPDNIFQFFGGERGATWRRGTPLSPFLTRMQSTIILQAHPFSINGYSMREGLGSAR